MKNLIRNCMVPVAVTVLAISLLSCKALDSDGGDSTISVDISQLLKNLPTAAASSSSSSQSSAAQASQSSSQVSSPTETDAQSAVKTLIVVPLTYSKHGQPYTTNEFDDNTQDDFEDDAVNSANFLQFIQLPTSASTIEVQVPTISEGWQLLAAATKGKVDAVNDIEGETIYYIGFTEQAFEDADDFNKANTTLELKRHCDQDEETDRPKGCATFDGDKEAIVTDSVEIHQIDINGADQGNGGNAFPWIVRATVGANEISETTAKTRLDAIKNGFAGGVATITNITVYVTHQESSAAQARAGCSALVFGSGSTAFKACTSDGEYQTNSRDY